MRSKFVISLCCLVIFSSCLKDGNFKMDYTGLAPLDIGDGWAISTPEGENINRDQMESAFQLIHKEDRFVMARSLLVIRNGKLIAESYPNSKQDITKYSNIQSCTKSITSMLVGAAIQDSLFASEEEKLFPIYPELFDEDAMKREITISDALTMRTGLDFRNDKHTQVLYTSSNTTQFVLQMERNHLPGTVFQYHDGAPQLVSKAIERRSGRTLKDYADERIFRKLGISNWKWEVARDGTTFGAFSLFLTPRDLGKIGQLLLNNGVWDNERLIDASYMKRAISNQITNNPRNSPYGYYFWLYPQWKAFAAGGHGGQFLFVAPSRNLVVVYTAWPYSDPELWDNGGELISIIYNSCK